VACISWNFTGGMYRFVLFSDIFHTGQSSAVTNCSHSQCRAVSRNWLDPFLQSNSGLIKRSLWGHGPLPRSSPMGLQYIRGSSIQEATWTPTTSKTTKRKYTANSNSSNRELGSLAYTQAPVSSTAQLVWAELSHLQTPRAYKRITF